MLLTNIATLVVLLVLLTVVPMIPGMIMSRFLSGGLQIDGATGSTRPPRAHPVFRSAPRAR